MRFEILFFLYLYEVLFITVFFFLIFFLKKFEIDLKSSRLTATDSLEVQLKDHENIGSNK